MTRCIRSLPFGPFATRMFAAASCLRSPTCAGTAAWASERIVPEACIEPVEGENCRWYEDRPDTHPSGLPQRNRPARKPT